MTHHKSNWTDPVRSDADFFGRVEEADLLDEHCNSVCVITGGKWIGKTSLLFRLQRRWKGDPQKPLGVYVHMGGFVPLGTPVVFGWLDYLLSAVVNDAPLPLAHPQPVRSVVDFATEIGSIANRLAENNTCLGICLLIDGADACMSFADEISSVVQYLRESNVATRLALGFVFSGGRQICEFSETYSSRLFQKAHIVPLGPLADADAIDLAKEILAHESADEMLGLCGGHPFILRAVADAHKRLSGSQSVRSTGSAVLHDRILTVRRLWTEIGFAAQELLENLLDNRPTWDFDIDVDYMIRVSPNRSPNDVYASLPVLYINGFLRRGSAKNTYRIGGSLLIDLVTGEKNAVGNQMSIFLNQSGARKQLARLTQFNAVEVSAITDDKATLEALRIHVGGGAAGFGGYYDTGATVRQQVGALFSVVRVRANIAYWSPPPDYSPHGQRVRLSDEVISTGGTCLDLAIFFCALIERVGLHPVIFLIRGHALAGFWVSGSPQTSRPEWENWSELEEEITANRLIPVETTMLDSNLGASFEYAIEQGCKVLDEESFEALVDICACRRSSISPQS